MSRAWLSLGSNVGDRLALLQFAAHELDTASYVSLTQKSSIYRTAPWGGVPQDDFYNCVLAVETMLDPHELLRCCIDIENRAGRVRAALWAARTLDIDILLYDDIVMVEPDLCLPHPYMQLRRFVLDPLLEIAGDIEIPGKGSLITLRKQCRDTLPVELLIPADKW